MPPLADEPEPAAEVSLKAAVQELKDLACWLDGLTALDRMNFMALLDLPNAPAVVAGHPDPEYRRRFTLVLAVRKLKDAAATEG